jgi:hypothetical protein
LALETPKGWLEVNEEMKGWVQLIQQLPLHLPGFPDTEDWIPAVTLPAFATNEKTLWHREIREQNRAINADR